MMVSALRSSKYYIVSHKTLNKQIHRSMLFLDNQQLGLNIHEITARLINTTLGYIILIQSH